MIECNRMIRRKMIIFMRVCMLILPLCLAIVLLTQTAFAKNTYYIRDGDRVTIHTTYVTDPAAVLDEAGLQLGEEDIVTTQPGNGMAEITILRKQMITVSYAGKTMEAVSYGETVAELLERLGFVLTQEDSLSVALNSQTYDGMQIRISRTVVRQETREVSVDFKTTYCYDSTLPAGEQRVLVQGIPGKAKNIVSVCYVDGKEVSVNLQNQTILQQPVDMVIAIGTAIIPEKDMPCGSGRLVIADGKITLPSGEVLTYVGYDAFVATAYCREEEGGEITAIGTPTRVGAIAVDPKVVPYGTRMFIVSQDGEYVYGVAVAEDCGSAIKGNRIDLFYETMPECVEFGVRPCDVYFLA